MIGRIILTGASGFVGTHLLQTLVTREDRSIVCTSRDPDRAGRDHPGQWARLDVDDEGSIRRLLQAGDRVVYLVHGMSSGPGYAEREQAAARAFARVARERDVARIVYLGGPRPPGPPSKHLASRLRTGRILRQSGVSTIELRAGMIMGPGSASWRVTRDLSARLPVMLLPRWLRNQCEPIAIDDVIAALTYAIDAPDRLAGAWDLPGPERLTYQDVLYRVAALGGTRPIGIRIPLLTPRLSSHWLRLVTRADMSIARELVDGLAYDLVSPDDGFFEHMPHHTRVGFEEGARRALDGEERGLSASTTAVESWLKKLSRAAAT